MLIAGLRSSPTLRRLKGPPGPLALGMLGFLPSTPSSLPLKLRSGSTSTYEKILHQPTLLMMLAASSSLMVNSLLLEMELAAIKALPLLELGSVPSSAKATATTSLTSSLAQLRTVIVLSCVPLLGLFGGRLHRPCT